MALAFSMNTTLNTLPSDSRLKLVYAIASPRACHSKGSKWKNRAYWRVYFSSRSGTNYIQSRLLTRLPFLLFHCPIPETRTLYRVLVLLNLPTFEKQKHTLEHLWRNHLVGKKVNFPNGRNKLPFETQLCRSECVEVKGIQPRPRRLTTASCRCTQMQQNWVIPETRTGICQVVSYKQIQPRTVL